jgi:V8-like Glu-specific endopeptidase
MGCVVIGVSGELTMRLKNPQLGEFLRAAQASFNPASLALVLRERLGLVYTNLTTPQPFPYQVLEVHDYFEQRNTVEELVVALRDARPAVAALATIADFVGFTKLPAGGLEVLARPAGDPYRDVEVFRSDLSKLEAAVCQVDTGGTLGTGTLIGPRVVLTNHHVVAELVQADGRLTTPVVCRFDFKTNAAGYKTPSTEVRSTAVLASSPHAAEDLVPGETNTSPGFLDYALLRLERTIDTEPIVAGGDPRGFVTAGSRAAALADHEGLVILQHPGGKPMKIDIGAVTQVGAMRIRHSVNTEPGSSGAPVFDASLNLVAIHHAGHADWPAAKLGYNQAVPMSRIKADAQSKQVAI